MARWILIAAGLLVVLLGCGIGFRVQDDVVDPWRQDPSGSPRTGVAPVGTGNDVRPLPGGPAAKVDLLHGRCNTGQAVVNALAREPLRQLRQRSGRAGIEIVP